MQTPYRPSVRLSMLGSVLHMDVSVYVCINKCLCSIYASRMLLCSCECTSVCMRACPHVCACVCVRAQMRMSVHHRTGVCVCACMHACLRIFMPVCTHMCECACLGDYALWHVCQTRLFLISNFLLLISNFLLLISNLHVCMLT